MLSPMVSALRDALPKRKSHGGPTPGSWTEMLQRNWHLGLTSFGGPAVHFQIFHTRFVDRYAWIEEQTYQELFALCQALPGPGSTKMIYAISVIRSGLLAGIVTFLIWSLPMAIAAYGLSLGVARIDETLPGPAYALLSGLNAATVGIVALAAVQLSQKAITDTLTRVLVFLGGTAGMLYNALWYFPCLMVAGGLAIVVHDLGLVRTLVRRLRTRNVRQETVEPGEVEEVEMQNVAPDPPPPTGSLRTRRGKVETAPALGTAAEETDAREPESQQQTQPSGISNKTGLAFSWKFGLAVTITFFSIFITVMVLRGTLSNPGRGFDLFANLFLAGTIIFGGGPVVIPLLIEYVVAEGWVSPRDFLLGLAIIQAFPGPNFNFAVYLGGLAAISSNNLPSVAGALIGYLAIFSPGLILHTGTMGVWQSIRRYQVVKSCLRGVHAAAVGLIYAAVYRLWEIGLINREFQRGTSLGSDPWWVVITATSFVGGMWFKLSAPWAIILGSVMGLIWYAVART